ncbi:hypothetical protein [Actinocrispum wychmicini]|uniref:RanBP2-type domain-containing protein n=1 Tax=Actinocrispum wychmicini TaxID=1213861 RepID=A0A4R2IWV8_9PSEU|nr:hypothetical protein [Actinocrispum wychmicini]TCO48916.1 hypothetical protein EV192_115137 [Actinocrispum wychmicini]
MTAVWWCGSCRTDNPADTTRCQSCDTAAPGTALQLVAPAQITLTPTVPVRRPTPPPATPPPATPPPVRRPATPPPARSRRPRLNVVPLVKAGGFGLGALAVVLLVGHALRQMGTTDPGPSAPACPTAAARWLPGGTGTLVAGYVTDKHVITVCQDGSGRLYYDGQQKGSPATADTHISIPAEATSTGFVATNKQYKYTITGSEVVVSVKGKPAQHWLLTRTGP